jgi:hypothetical protein
MLQDVEGVARRQIPAGVEVCEINGVVLLIAGQHAQPLVALDRAGRLDRFGREDLAADLDEALEKARRILGERSADSR